MSEHKAFFGDAEHTFKLTPALILELEGVTGAGIGALARRVFRGDFRHVDILATLRLGLIGGGMASEAAARLVETYGANRPLGEAYQVAVGVLEAAWFGAARTVEDVIATEEAAMTAALTGELAA